MIVETIYKLGKMDYDSRTNSLYIPYSQITVSQTIVKYRQVNYERFPIYGDKKEKEKKGSVTIFLNGETLENLMSNKNEVIAQNAEYIIRTLMFDGTITKSPSWYQKKILENERMTRLQKARQENNRMEKLINDALTSIADYETAIDPLVAKYYHLTHCIFKTKRRMEKRNQIMNDLDNIMNFRFQELVKLKQYEIEYKANPLSKTTAAINKDIDERIKDIKPLLIDKEASSNDFTLLKEYKAPSPGISGIYILHNREKDKYYVGQSKNVRRRLQQHFENTVPKNPIFAEDYWTSSFPHKDDLFEVKVIPCDKGDLDRLERTMIAHYDSFNKGYNKTRGNN